mmetsp:Transcript_31008/g.46247  ORF Transcript_31008/g.46247 Transcript_31008/m.46247 type:complete len:243 (-) Transcript_31008:112-840(-)
MRLSIAIVLAYAAATTAFTSLSPAPAFKHVSPLYMSSEVSAAVPIVVTGNNIEVTDALQSYIDKKLQNTVGKLASSGAVQSCDVHLTVNKNKSVKNSHKAEVTTVLKGTVIRSSQETPDMYASIDLVADRVARKLTKYKERRLDGYHGGPHIGENLADVLNEIEEPEEAVAEDVEEFIDPEAAQVTKIKSFDLSKPISVKEAIFALDYIDHDFYVFRDDETNEVSVVYKRNAGGVGLIQPEQ